MGCHAARGSQVVDAEGGDVGAPGGFGDGTLVDEMLDGDGVRCLDSTIEYGDTWCGQVAHCHVCLPNQASWHIWNWTSSRHVLSMNGEGVYH